MALLRTYSLETDDGQTVNVRETDNGFIEIRKTGSRSRITLTTAEAAELKVVLGELT